MTHWNVLILTVGLSAFPAGVVAQTEYTADGEPTALEEEIRWLMNRGRFDSARENAIRGTTYADAPAKAPPLAPHEALTQASRHHSEDMARQNVFQHATVPGSSYYNPTTQPQPWDRMTAEGYSWNRVAENIAAGYGNAEPAYVGWWNSTGHRVNMYNAALREVGNGYFQRSGSAFGRYYTMDLGSTGSTHFFTDTVFGDANSDGTYDQGEGIAGVRVRLRVHGTLHGSSDRSSGVGSFAVPIQAIVDGATVDVLLANPTAATLILSVPRSYSSNATIVLAAGGETVVGSFTQPSGAVNVGFRDLTPAVLPITPPPLVLAGSGGSLELRWPSESGVDYLPQWTTNFTVWNDLTATGLAGTGATMAFVDSQANAGAPDRFYRLVARRP